MKIEFGVDTDAGPMVSAPPAIDTAAPPLRFDLPHALLTQLFAVSFGYLAVMGLAFRAGTGIGLIFAVFGLVLLAYYGLPLVMARASGARNDPVEQRRGAWGIDTASGYLPGRAAFAQVMTVPLLMLAWAVFIAFLRLATPTAGGDPPPPGSPPVVPRPAGKGKNLSAHSALALWQAARCRR